jgi:LDH2 family malate/lactate/ureidoglycolate dehydrogenase
VPLDQFKREASALIARVKAAPRRPGVDEIRLPSERALREREARRKDDAIFIERAVYDQLRALPTAR